MRNFSLTFSLSPVEEDADEPLTEENFKTYFFLAIALPNQTRGQNQQGSTGKFGTKIPGALTWRGLLRRLFEKNSGVVVKCKCDGKPKTKATTAIKHIERNHEDVETKEITLDDFTVEFPKGISYTI
jgi:hypothetical protein